LLMPSPAKALAMAACAAWLSWAEVESVRRLNLQR
jgi:hypothetical protein